MNCHSLNKKEVLGSSPTRSTIIVISWSHTDASLIESAQHSFIIQSLSPYGPVLAWHYSASYKEVAVLTLSAYIMNV